VLMAPTTAATANADGAPILRNDSISGVSELNISPKRNWVSRLREATDLNDC
jgi:hypothetical protein